MPNKGPTNCNYDELPVSVSTAGIMGETLSVQTRADLEAVQAEHTAEEETRKTILTQCKEMEKARSKY